MIANRRRRGATSRKSSSRLPAVSAAWTDNSVTLPPDRERLATRPAPIGSNRKCKNDGYRRSRLLQSGNCATISDNNINVLSDELRSKISDAVGISLRPAIFDRDGATLDPADFTQSLRKSSRPRTPARSAVAQEPNDLKLCWLRARRERPSDSRATKNCDEFPPLHGLPRAEGHVGHA